MIKELEIYNSKILIVDDQELSIRLLKGILEKEGFSHIRSTNDPTKAVQLYQDIKPDCVALDLNMPGVDGFSIMAELKLFEKDSYLPLIVISGENTTAARLTALEKGAKDFLDKPYDRVEVVMRIRNIIETRLLHKQLNDQNVILEERVKARTRELYDTQLDVIERLARAIEYRDFETGMHISRMSHYCVCLAEKLGLNSKECELILRSAPLHDIGKIGIPDVILQKPGRLTKEEFEIMKSHTTIGAELLSGGQSEFLLKAKEIALTHHEKWDGSGYPQGLKKEMIPVNGRISCICDVFDALITKRPYKEAWSFEQAMKEIRDGRGTLFDPQMVDAFLEIKDKIQEIKNKYSDPPKILTQS